MRRETKLMHYGRNTAGPGPANPPVVRASTILHDSVAAYRDTKRRRESDDSVLSYGRRGTTTAHVLADAVRDLEGGDASFLFPTGVAALAGAISAFAGAGDHLLIVDTVFPATRSFCESQLRRNGVEIDYIPWDTIDLSPWITAKTKAVMVESPASQTFEVMDLPALCRSATAKGITVIADNTYGSGWLYHPLELGCDVSVIAGTKYLSGHADVMMGVASARGEACAPLRAVVHASGQTLAPDEAYACLRGMRTLGLRLERHHESGLLLADYFAKRPEVSEVLHPGLTGHPGHEIWRRDASGCNGLLSVRFRPGFALEAFLDRLQIFSIGSSWGGFESLAMPIAPDESRSFVKEESPDPMARFHIGLEHPQDLIEDLTASFAVLED
ncbi:cystathionine beta-lyase [Denitrobaculum tricleocarpae]|uniref:Cystathionine beta-lyase n=1 Tax=Denitrobaculum tricleocarpae TaxID=2591009 RepID=A0A545TX49_9PROT|nr:cystathionine beta-lyase [Denitrobaculum tricleocarpae]TQV81793.1 cystathionine beta-lyase [Denitrobaculum tricleocarpae]